MKGAKLIRLIQLIATLSAAMFIISCRGEQNALDAAGPNAGNITNLWWLMFYVLTVVFVIVSAILLVAIYRGRKQREKSNDAPDIKPNEARENRMTKTIAGAIALTAVILFVFLIVNFTTGRAINSLSNKQTLIIKITGHQWWWDVEYQDPVASNTFKTANEIHIPVGQVVEIKLYSNDVIHSFWVPNLAGKKDLIPGLENTIWIKADRAGKYLGQCAEFCGLQHAHMRFVVIAESTEEFNSWLASQRQPAVEPANDLQKKGQQVFLSSPCIMCHTIRGTVASGRVAPDLTHLASRQSIAAGTLPNTRGHLGGWISNSQEIKPGNQMPPIPLSAEDLQALLTYLESLK